MLKKKNKNISALFQAGISYFFLQKGIYPVIHPDQVLCLSVSIFQIYTIFAHILMTNLKTHKPAATFCFRGADAQYLINTGCYPWPVTCKWRATQSIMKKELVIHGNAFLLKSPKRAKEQKLSSLGFQLINTCNLQAFM